MYLQNASLNPLNCSCLGVCYDQPLTNGTKLDPNILFTYLQFDIEPPL
jgi:hypothetical protein